MKQIKSKTTQIMVGLMMLLLLIACSPTADEGSSPTSSPSETTKTLFVGAEKADCVGMALQECLLVKENADDEYTFFYDDIEGFTWESGFEYELLVKVTEIENPPADASSSQYTLVEEVNKTAVAVAPLISMLDGTWTLESLVMDGETIQLPDGSSAFLTIEGDKVTGSF